MKKENAPRFDHIQLVWGVVLVVLMTCSAFAVTRLLRVLPKENFEQKITGSIKRQGEWFIRNQNDTGDFVYERTVATGEVTKNNNIVRQAGALYGLAQVYGAYKDPEIQRMLEKGFQYFHGLTATRSADASVVTHKGEAPSNATALVVLGLVEYMEADPTQKTTENLEYLTILSNYLVSTQTTSGAYINEYVPRPVESDYNNGETMYALIRSYNLTQKESYLISVKRAANYAIYYYGKQRFNASFFSWGMAGFSYLYKVDPDDRYWVFLREHADKYMRDRGDQYEKYLSQKSKVSIPPGAAVFIEGVNHIAWIAKEKDSALYKNLTRHIRRILDFLPVYEISGPYGRFTSTSDKVSGAICSQVTCEITRIDFLQHTMSAMLLYRRFLQ